MNFQSTLRGDQTKVCWLAGLLVNFSLAMNTLFLITQGGVVNGLNAIYLERRRCCTKAENQPGGGVFLACYVGVFVGWIE